MTLRAIGHTPEEMQERIGKLLAKAGASIDDLLSIARYLSDLHANDARYRWLRQRGVLLTMSEYGELHRDQLDLRCDEAMNAVIEGKV